MTPTPCPDCGTPVSSFPSAAIVPIVLELAPRGWDCKRNGALVVRAGLATVTTTPAAGETVYRAHAPWCGRAAA